MLVSKGQSSMVCATESHCGFVMASANYQCLPALVIQQELRLRRCQTTVACRTTKYSATGYCTSRDFQVRRDHDAKGLVFIGRDNSFFGVQRGRFLHAAEIDKGSFQ